MQKKLLSLAIAGALAAPSVAMADITSGGGITIYGKFHASWDYVDTDIDTGNKDDNDDNTAVFRNSRLGFKGSEDLGNGLKGIWQVETHLDTASGTGSTGSLDLRNTFVGLASDQWGKIVMGRHDTPYKTATAKLDIFSDTIADYNTIIGAHIADIDAGTDDDDSVIAANGIASSFNEREPQLVMYTTPNFNGFSAQIARQSYQEDDDDGGSLSDEELEGWSVMAMYDQGPFFASVAYEVFSGDLNGSSVSVADGEDEEIDAWKLGLGYTFGNSKIAFVYEDIEHDNDASEFASRDAYWGAFSHKFGKNVIKLAYGKADDSDVDDADDGADHWSIGIDHHFSKRTKLYAIYTDMDNDDEGYYTLYNESNASSDGYKVGAGQDSDAFSIGIVHTF